MRNSAICLTFDYELFFGNASGTVENCILKPTSLLLDLFEKMRIKSTFFIDVLFYGRLLEQKDASLQVGLIREQLQRIVSLGSRIELHLHPHWMDAVYEGPFWKFTSYRNYCLESLATPHIQELFVQGTDTLNLIASEAVTGYSCRVFRAGGFALPPFHRMIDAFRKSGITVDSSVAGGLFIEHSDYRVEYPVIKKDCYRFSTDPLTETEDGEFVEVPISTRRISIFQKIARRLSKYREEPTTFGDGTGMVYSNSWKRRLRSSSRLLSLDRGGQDDVTVKALKSRNLWTLVSHPKSMNIVALDILRELHDSGFQFVTVKEACASDR